MTAGGRVSVYRGRLIELGLETAVLPNGATIELEIVRHPGGAVVLALDEADRVCLLRQYRHVVGDWIWELPAGVIEAGEDPLETAQRELREEAGLVAAQWRELGTMLPSPGFIFLSKTAFRANFSLSKHFAFPLNFFFFIPATFTIAPSGARLPFNPTKPPLGFKGFDVL